MTEENLRTLRQLAATFPAFSEASLRWHVFHARTNGLDCAIVRLGRRVLVDEAKFREWVASRAVPGVDRVERVRT